MKRLFRLFIKYAFAILVIFSFYIPSNLTALAANDARWLKVNIPAEGSGGGWALANGSDARCLTRTIDGTLYVYASPSGTSYRLFKSKDRGISWAATGRVTDAIVSIAAAPDNDSVIYYASASAVYRSSDGGENFIQLPPSPGGAGAGNIEITSVAVSRADNGYTIAVATCDKDAGGFGGVYTLGDSNPLTWFDTALGNYDAYAVSFSPSFAQDRQMTAVMTDETDTFVSFRTAGGGWGAVTGNDRLNCDNAPAHLPVAVTVDAVIVHPDGYNADPASGKSVIFLGVNAGGNGGDVYRVDCQGAPAASLTVDLNAGAAYGPGNIDITGLAVRSELSAFEIFAGASLSGQVYASLDGGRSWSKALKPPTGGSRTLVLLPSETDGNTQIYAVTSGAESAFSASADGGITWSQLSLVDTQIIAGGILDFVPSPLFSADNTLFLLSTGAKQSLWRSVNAGITWERVFSSALPGVDSLRYLELPPDYSPGNETLYLTGLSGGNPVIWKSVDNGKTFECYPAPVAADVTASAAGKHLFLGGFDGASGLVYHSGNAGFFFDPGAGCGTQRLYSIALSPAFQEDKTILAGNNNGGVYLSTDGGKSFLAVPSGAASPPLSGNISVAFDPDFAENKIIYAASSTADKGVFRFVPGKSSFWENIDTTLPAGSSLRGLAVSGEGVLYTANFKADAGAERSLDPSGGQGAVFERLNRGLESGAKLEGIWLSGDRLWTVDNINTSLLTFKDSLAQPVKPASPEDNASGVGMLSDHKIRGVSLDWEAVSGAESYRWQLTTDPSFYAVPAGFDGETGASSVALPPLEPGTTYAWRVKVSQPVTGDWSEKRSFTTGLGEAVSTIELKFPGVAESDVPLKPVFHWTGVAGAEGYELAVSPEPAFISPVISRTGDFSLPSTAWESNIRLEYGTTYFWKVRAVNAISKSAWSAVSAFTTGQSPPTPPVSPEAHSPLPDEVTTRGAPEPPLIELDSEATSIPDWALVLIGGLASAVVILLVIVLAQHNRR